MIIAPPLLARLLALFISRLWAGTEQRHVLNKEDNVRCEDNRDLEKCWACYRMWPVSGPDQRRGQRNVVREDVCGEWGFCELLGLLMCAAHVKARSGPDGYRTLIFTREESVLIV